MSFRTNLDRLLDNIDRERRRDEDGDQVPDNRRAVGRELDTSPLGPDATNPERMRRIFRVVEEAYKKAAQAEELGKLAARFRGIADLHHHHARGDVSVTVRYLDADRPEDIGLSPFEIHPRDLEEAKKETGSSRPDLNALKVLRRELRNGVLAAYAKLEPRVRDALRERADQGHLAVQVVMDLRPAE